MLDLGCGTGELTRRLAACGYDMTGVDVSVDMLQKAMEKQTDPPILYLLQEMQTLELDGCVRAVCCTCDCVNYVLEPQELSDAFRRVAACLESGGVFIFDMNTAYKYEQLLEITHLRRAGRKEVLSGKIIMTKRPESMNMT